MRILGIDPGLRVTGYGVIDVSKGRVGARHAVPLLNLVEAGVVRTGTGGAIASRLAKIHRALSELIAETRPAAIVIEKLYAHTRHPATAILMAHARGVVCLLSGEHGVPLHSIASTHVKKAVTGRGHAAKSQVQRMVQHELSLKQAPEPADVADALAVAIAFARNMR